jgi:acetyl-CoA C-acetyltransferase
MKHLLHNQSQLFEIFVLTQKRFFLVSLLVCVSIDLF